MSATNYAATLEARTGVAREIRVIPPDGTDRPLWTVAVDIGMKDRRDDRSTLDITWVGAAGARRAGTFVRAAGEAVERAALLGLEPLDPGAGSPWAPRGMSWSTDAEEGSGYGAVLVDGARSATVRVPAVAVDYPPRGGDDGADPGPSGTASGIGLPMAISAACKESLERDAAMRCWYDPATARLVDIGTLGAVGAVEASLLMEKIKPAGVEFHVVLLDSPNAAATVLALAIDRHNGVVGAGLGLEPRPAQAVLRAVQESLQIRTLLLDLRRAGEVAAPRLPIEREIDRAAFWASAEAVAAADEWLRRVPSSAGTMRTPGAKVDWTAMVGRYVVVDLTPRIPPAARDLGWAVARVFCPDLHPLRMSEALIWNTRGASHGIPHPFV